MDSVVSLIHYCECLKYLWNAAMCIDTVGLSLALHQQYNIHTQRRRHYNPCVLICILLADNKEYFSS